MGEPLRYLSPAVTTEELGDDQRRIISRPMDPNIVVWNASEWVTRYPVSLIERVLDVAGPGGVVEEIRREEDPAYVQLDLEHDLFGYVPREHFAGARILDFGCGGGSSTVILGRLLPSDVDLPGVDLLARHIELGRARAEHYGLGNVRFKASPSGSELPEDLGTFDYIVLSAALEHMLPDERRHLLPLVWSHLKPGGVLFLDQTPHRYFPVEVHTTGLPLLNYLPDSLTRLAATRFSDRLKPGDTWPDLLRKGIRGSTPSEVRRRLGRSAYLLRPIRGDRIDLWHRVAEARGPSR
ncbi:MAG: class I SAM-dependent methyltransferase, partial [Bacteroidota bacterium]